MKRNPTYCCLKIENFIVTLIFKNHMPVLTHMAST